MGPCIAKVFSSITNKMQRYTSSLFLWNALHVLGGSSAHHQELKIFIYSVGYFSTLFCYLPLSWKRSNCSISSTIVPCSRKGLTSTRCCIYSFWAPDNGRRNHLKHIEYFTEINKLCNLASCWLYLKIYSWRTFLLEKPIFAQLSKNNPLPLPFCGTWKHVTIYMKRPIPGPSPQPKALMYLFNFGLFSI